MSEVIVFCLSKILGVGIKIMPLVNFPARKLYFGDSIFNPNIGHFRYSYLDIIHQRGEASEFLEIKSCNLCTNKNESTLTKLGPNNLHVSSSFQRQTTSMSTKAWCPQIQKGLSVSLLNGFDLLGPACTTC